MERVVAELTATVTGAVAATGYWGILVLMALESACIPIPSEIIMPFAGYLASRGELSLAGASVAGAAGCVVGSCAAYAVGARGGRPAIERWGRWVLIAPHELELADRWFARWGRAAVFGARLLPVVRTFIALPAGIARMEVWPFIWLTFLGSLPWCAALAYGGFVLAERWMTLRERLHGLDTAMVVVLGLGFLAFLWHRVRALRAAGLFDRPGQNR
jgi:membrane protein DedA with SNARE-associated domain